MCRLFPVLLLMPILMAEPSQADFLLNCRLMTPESPEKYRRHCKWETVVKCEPGEPCEIKRQNFVSGYSNSVLSANPQWLAAVSINDPRSGISTVAGISRPAELAGTTSDIRATGSEVGHALSEALNDPAARSGNLRSGVEAATQ